MPIRFVKHPTQFVSGLIVGVVNDIAYKGPLPVLHGKDQRRLTQTGLFQKRSRFFSGIWWFNMLHHFHIGQKTVQTIDVLCLKFTNLKPVGSLKHFDPLHLFIREAKLPFPLPHRFKSAVGESRNCVVVVAGDANTFALHTDAPLCTDEPT